MKRGLFELIWVRELRSRLSVYGFFSAVEQFKTIVRKPDQNFVVSFSLIKRPALSDKQIVDPGKLMRFLVLDNLARSTFWGRRIGLATIPEP